MAKKDFNDFMSQIEERYGDILAKSTRKSISSGSFSLDVSTELGGFGLGRISILYGAPGSAKTTLCLSSVRDAIEKGYNTLYVDVENMLDMDYAENIVGIKPNDPDGRFVVLQPDTAEDSLNIAGAGILSKKFNLVIIDSVGALSPKKEKVEMDMEKQDVAIVSKLFSKFLRIYFHAIQTNDIALLIVNQVRANIGSYMGGYSMPGGYALAHASSLTVFLSKGQDIKIGDDVVGADIKFNIKKNKSGRPFRSHSFPLMFGEGIDYFRDTILFAKDVGAIQQAGAYYRLDGVNLGRGMVETLDNIRGNPELLAKITERCYNAVKHIKPVKEEDETEVELGEGV